jgi:hypothetical protein
MKHHYWINLHQSDPHREGPFHVRRHIRPPKKVLNISNAGAGEIFKAVIMEDENGKLEGFIINDPNNVLTGINNQYYLYYKKGISRSEVNLQIGSFFGTIIDPDIDNVYDISASHDHTF